jgi:hypothetical protein
MLERCCSAEVCTLTIGRYSSDTAAPLCTSYPLNLKTTRIQHAAGECVHLRKSLNTDASTRSTRSRTGIANIHRVWKGGAEETDLHAIGASSQKRRVLHARSTVATHATLSATEVSGWRKNELQRKLQQMSDIQPVTSPTLTITSMLACEYHKSTVLVPSYMESGVRQCTPHEQASSCTEPRHYHHP